MIALGQLADIGFSPTIMRLTAFAMGGASDLRDFRTARGDPITGSPNWGVMERLYGNINIVALKLMTAIAEVSKAPFYSKIPVFSRLRAEGNITALARRAGASMEISLFAFSIGILIAGLFMAPRSCHDRFRCNLCRSPSMGTHGDRVVS